MNKAEKLLEQSPEMARIPEHVESLELCAFDLAQEMKGTAEQIAEREESACELAQSESNDTKRRAKKKELLRADSSYQALLVERTEQERLHLRVTARAARLRREYRASLLEVEIRQLGRRA